MERLALRPDVLMRRGVVPRLFHVKQKRFDAAWQNSFAASACSSHLRLHGARSVSTSPTIE